MPNDPFQINLPGGSGVPMPGTGNDPLGQQINIGELLKKIMAKGQQSHLQGPGVGTQAKLQQASQRTPMQQGPFENRSEGMQGFMHNVGAAVSNAVKQHKEKEITTAMNDWQVMQKAWEDSQMVAEQSGKNPQEIFQKMPSVKAILEDKKKMKNIAKSLQMDWLNPEKTTVYQEAAKRHAEQDKSGKMMKFFKSMMGKGGPQMGLQQGQVNPQKMAQEETQKIAASASPAAPDYKAQLDVAKTVIQKQEADSKVQEHYDDMKVKYQEHLDNLQQHEMQLKMQMQDKAANRDQQKELAKERMMVQQQIAQGNQALKAMQMQMMSDKQDLKRQDSLRKQHFIYEGKLVDGTQIPEDSFSKALPVKDPQGTKAMANTYKTIVFGFNQITDRKYDKLWDHKGANQALTQAMEHFGAEGSSAGVGGAVSFKAPAGLSDSAAKNWAKDLVPDNLKPLFYEYVANLRGMQERLMPMTQIEQGGKIGRGSTMQLSTMVQALPGPGTMSSQQARTALRNVRNLIDMHADDFGGYDGELLGGVKLNTVEGGSDAQEGKKPSTMQRMFPSKNPMDWFPKPD